jgi:metallo-beta-lactamase class B
MSMRRCWLTVLALVPAGIACLPTIAVSQDAEDRSAAHIATARAAVYRPGNDFSTSFDQICGERPPRRTRLDAGTLVPESPNAPASRTVPPPSQWREDPVQVFDNLYFVGSRNNSMWVVTTSEGIILHDTSYDYMVDTQIVEGLRTLGLDAADIKYVIIAQAHSDHYFGAKQIQDRYGARIIMSDADWELMADDSNPPELKPRRDLVATDGMELTLGDTTLKLYLTPGHTPGTISTLIPLRDGDQTHLGSIWGGNSFGVRHFDEAFDALRAHSASANRFRDIVVEAGVDVFLSSHTSHDKTLDKLNALRFRNPGDPHPFVSADAVERYLTVISECTEATLEWLVDARRNGTSLRHSVESGLR